MRILLVDDCDQKSAQVEALFRKNISTLEIDRAKSFRTAVRALESRTYDLLILDLMLPVRDGEAPTEQGGRQVLSEILDGSGCRHPSHVVCLTAFEEMAGAFRDEAEKKLVHVVIYNELVDRWSTPLTEKVRSIETRLRESTLPPSYKIDVAVVTSSPLVELQEILKLSDFEGEYHQSDLLHYFSASWVSTSKRHITVVACAAPSMGMTAACVTACKVIERWRPRFLVMTGLAAGTKKQEQEFGDILVAEAAYDYGSGKIAETEGGGRIFVPSPSQLRIDADLHAILQRWEREQFRMDAIKRAWYDHETRAPRLIVGLLATGAAVVQNQELVDDILNKSRKVVGLDMEAYAIFQAAVLATAPRPRVLIAKSVSDFGDKRKDDKWQRYAAFTSARFIYEFFITATDLEAGSQADQE